MTQARLRRLEMARRALITGGAGFIGKYVIRDLLAHGWDCTGFDLSPAPAGLDCNWITSDVRDAAALARACKGINTVFHLAAQAHLFARNPAIYEDVNVGGTRNVLSACLSAQVQQLIATSSATALTPVGYHGPVDESTPQPGLTALAGPYSRSKWRAAHLLSDKALAGRIKIIRLYPTVPLGAEDDGMTAPTAFLNLLVTQPPPALLETQFDFVSVQSLADAHRRAADRCKIDGAYVLSGETLSLEQVISNVVALTGRPLTKRRVPYAAALMAAHFAQSYGRLTNTPTLTTVEGVRLAKGRPVFSNAKAREELGWHPGDTHAAFSSALEWVMQRA